MDSRDYNVLHQRDGLKVRDPKYFEPVDRPSAFEIVKTLVLETLWESSPKTPVLDLHPRYQPSVDFVQLNLDGIGAVIVKLTQGMWSINGSVEYCLRAQDADLGVMVYHWFEDDEDGTRQAEYHLEHLLILADRLGYSPPTWADVEEAYQSSVFLRRQRLHDYLQTVGAYREGSGCYSSRYKWLELIGDVSWAANFEGWLAAWTSVSPPVLPIGWAEAMLRLWQIGISGYHHWVPLVPGVEGKVDYNLFYGNMEALRKYIGMDEVVPPPVDPICHCQEEIDSINVHISSLEEDVTTHDVEIGRLATEVAILSMYHDEPPPPPPPPPTGNEWRNYQVTTVKALAKFIGSYNNNDLPLISEYPYDPRIRYDNGETLTASVDKLAVAGGGKAVVLKPGENNGKMVPEDARIKEPTAKDPRLFIEVERIQKID